MATQQDIAGRGHSNTPKLFKYVLNSTDYGQLVLTNVPVGWDGAELTFIRDPKYKGVLQEFSTNELDFPKEGRGYIQTAYEAKGIDYNISINIFLQNNSTFEYESYFTGKIDLSGYGINSTRVKGKIIATGFQNTILNRDKMKVDLLNTKFVGGGEGSMAQITGMPSTLRFPPYTATKDADWELTDLKENPPQSYTHYVPMNVNSSEFASGSATQQTFDGVTPFFTSADTKTVTVKGNIILDFIDNDTNTTNVTIRIYLYKNSTIIQTYTDSGTGDIVTFNFAVDESVSLIATDELSFQALATHDGDVGDMELDYYDGTITVSEDIGASLAGVDVVGYPIFEFTARILQLISGETNPLESTLIGRTDSLPTSYGSDGDGSLIVKTKGQWIRSFPITEGGSTVQTFNGSLDDAFKDINARENAGLGFEVRSGVNKVVIEKEAYFFDITDNPNYPATETEAYLVNQILDFSSVLTQEVIEKEVLPDWYANEVDSGYKKYEYEFIQGLKEFNTKSSYATPIKAVKNKLDLTSPDRFDTQGANKLRSKPYDTYSTEDVNGDNNVFGFDVKRLGVFTVKTNEDFDIVSGGIDPENSYNLNYTPRRNLERHGNRLRSMRLALGDEIQFLETDKNSKLITQKTGETENKAESGDIVVEDLIKGYWIAEAYIFEAPVDESVIAALRANPYGVIKLSNTQYAWVLEVQTNNQRKKGQFKTLRVDLDNVKIVT
jgi:hypothetical protein